MRARPLDGWRGWRRRALLGAGLAAGGTLAGTAAAAAYVVNALTRPGRPTPSDDFTFTPFELGVPYEDVTFMPEVGDHVVRGWWLPRPETRRVIIACPGYRASRADLLGISSALWRAGNNVLLFDFHGHGAGLGAPVTLAYRELYDLLGALDYVLRRVPGAAVGVIGYSMGAAVAIRGAARRHEVRALVADSSFATHEGEVRYVVGRAMRLPPVAARLVAHAAEPLLRWRAGYRHADVEPLRDIAGIAPRPILLIHATADERIPVEDAYRLFEAAGEPKALWVDDGASHCGVYFVDRARYSQRVASFFRDHLTEQLAESVAALPRASTVSA
jgi:fermentation-respiration switch protein FrsA (DUF1100 family)